MAEDPSLGSRSRQDAFAWKLTTAQTHAHTHTQCKTCFKNTTVYWRWKSRGTSGLSLVAQGPSSATAGPALSSLHSAKHVALC